jgi:hypothetical protein
MSEQWTILWHDSGREPQVAPNPAYPDGKDVSMVLDDRVPHCTTPLPYPARRCGWYEVVCRTCTLRVGVTTAGRPDDPRSVTVPCRQTQQQEEGR